MSNELAQPLPAVHGSMTQSFGSTSMTAGVESAAAAVAAQARATVEARYVMALRAPRNWDQVRQDVIRECRRPSFANNKSAFYKKPIGQGVEGLGIRFVEVALRCMRNVLVESSIVFEDDLKEIHRVTITDLESNLTYPLDVRVSRTVERSKPEDDGSFISVRKNSYNKNVYTVRATDDDLLNKRGALISKAIRTLGLRIIPGDIQDEAEEIIKSVRMDDAAKDPDKNRKILADLFAEIGVKASDLSSYIGHDLSSCTPKEIVELRAIHGAISSGEATWAEVMDNKAQQGGDGKGNGRTSAPAYPDDLFKKNLPAWLKLIAEGKKTPDQIITTAQTKGPLSDAQKAEIRGESNSTSASAEASSAQASNGGAGAAASNPAVTYAQVEKKLRDAAATGDVELLDAEADLIRDVSDEQQRKELGDLYHQLRDQLSQ